MSVRLERYAFLMLVTLALVAVMLAVLPAVAEAKEGTEAATPQQQETSNRNAEATPTTMHTVVVVRPGDSLWSISEERLGPNATAQRIDRETERLWALNRERIGADPNLILPGQVLSVPPVNGPSVNQPLVAGAADANEFGEASERAAKRTPFPDAAAVQPVPAARPLTSDASLPEDGYAKRRLLGSVLLALSFGIASILAFLAARKLWKRLAKRSVGEPLAEEAYRTNYALFSPSLADTEEAPRSAPAPATVRGFGVYGDGAPAKRNRLKTFTSARRKRRRRKSLRRSRLLRERLATGAHNPNVLRRLRGASDAPRKRRRAKEPRRSAITRELANASKARGAGEGGRQR